MPETLNKPEKSFLSKPFSFVKSIILPVGLSILANGIFALIFMGAWLSGATLNTSVYALVLFAIFLLGFPFFYFWLAKKQAIYKGISWLYHGSSTYINQGVDWVVGAAVKSQHKKIMGVDVNSAVNSIDGYLPKGVKVPLKFLFNQLPLADIMEEVRSEIEVTEENLPAIKLSVQQKVNNYVEGELLAGSSFWFWGLVLVNIAAMGIAWMFFA